MQYFKATCGKPLVPFSSAYFVDVDSCMPRIYIPSYISAGKIPHCLKEAMSPQKSHEMLPMDASPRLSFLLPQFSWSYRPLFLLIENSP